MYEALLSARGDNPAPRFTYDRGTLEIMSPSGKHEWLKRLLGRFIETFTLEQGTLVRSAGSTTFKSQMKTKGLEPDECYYVQNEHLVRGKDDLDLTVDPPPDLAIEIDLSSSSLDKLGIYSSLGVRELWTRDRGGLVVHELQASGEYALSDQSKVLPGLTVADLNRFLEQRKSLDETNLVRSFQRWVGEQFPR
jgi:Uma2 family endonuclease